MDILLSMLCFNQVGISSEADLLIINICTLSLLTVVDHMYT